MTTITKSCLTCNTSFTAYSNRQTYCSKKCRPKITYKKIRETNTLEKLAEAKRIWRENNPEKNKAARVEWRKNNPDKFQNTHYRNSGYMLDGKPFTYSDFNDFLIKQNNKCAGCKVDFDTIDKRNICIDHKHDETKQVRGILCRNCNLALGNARDNEDTLASLILYIRENKGAEVL